MIAGPSEVLVIADRTANPEYVAADLLSQAEHDPLAAVVLVTDSGLLADNVAYELTRQVAKLERRDIDVYKRQSLSGSSPRWSRLSPLRRPAPG